MTLIDSNRGGLSYADKPPVLIVASSDIASARAVRTVETAGFRVAGQVSVESASKRIELQVSTAAVWVELDDDPGEIVDRLMSAMSLDVAAGRYSGVVAAPTMLLDPLAAAIGNQPIELIIDADEAERVACLAVATSSAASTARLADVASDQSAERLRQLSEEVSRIATTLSRLSSTPGPAPRVIEPIRGGDLPPISADTVRTVIRARRLRARYFSEELFADPAWDMLLDLLQAELSHLRVPVSSLCIAASVPATTALRWLKTLVSRGLFVRRADPHDGRRVFVELSPETSQALRRYFADIGPTAAV